MAQTGPMIHPHDKEPKRLIVGERVTIYRRGKRGIYCAEFHYNGHRRQSLKTTKLKTAKKLAIVIAADVFKGTYTPRRERRPKSKATLKEVIQEFLQFHRTEGTRLKTISKYRGILTRFSDFAIEHKAYYVSQVDLSLIDKYRARRKLSLSPKSMHHEGALLKAFLNWCIPHDHLSENPLAARKFSPPKQKHRKEVLTLRQINAILDAASALRKPVLALLAFAGPRSGEVRNLLVTDVDRNGNWIHIFSREGFPTKEGNEWKVPIHPRLREILETLPAQKSGWFFTALPSRKFPDGSHFINTKHLNEDFLKILNRLGIPAGRENGGFTIHSLRHFFKTFCITHGVPKPVVDQWQGHAMGKDPSEVYFHLSDEDSRRLMKSVPFGEPDGSFES